MDGLSVAASIIALVQAAGAIGKGIKFLHGLKNIPNEFCDAINQLTTLQAVLGQVESALKEYDDENSRTPMPDMNLTGIRMIKKELHELVESLDSLCSRLQTTGKMKDGKLQISRTMWLRQKSIFEAIRDRALNARENLTFHFGALASTQALVL